MKTIYELETYQEFCNANSNCRQEGDSKPLIMGKLRIVSIPHHFPFVKLVNDPNYRFEMALHEFLNETFARQGFEVAGTATLTGGLEES